MERARLRVDADGLARIGSAEYVRGLGKVGVRTWNDQRVVIAGDQEHGWHDFEQLPDHFPGLGSAPLVRPRTVEQVAGNQNRVNLVLTCRFREEAKCPEYGLRPLSGVRPEGGVRGAKVYVRKVQDTHHAAYLND
jgi:hypothetical protein